MRAKPPPVTKRVFELLFGKVTRVSRIGFKQTPCVQVQCPLNDYHVHTKCFFERPTNFSASDENGLGKVKQ